VTMILEAFAQKSDMSLVFVGNWNNSDFGHKLKQRYETLAHLYLLDPIYDIGVLRTIRSNAALYVHGHSAGGTNPSLVEMMHFGLPVLAYDCIYNRSTTEGKAVFFNDADDLKEKVNALTETQMKVIGTEMLDIAQRRYTWDEIGRLYFELLK